MKKITFISIFFLIYVFLSSKSMYSEIVMSEINTDNGHYELIFDEEPLKIGTLKLKLGLFTSYEYNITKVYIKYDDDIKEYFYDKKYFSFDSSNFNNGIEKLKREYNLVLKQNYLYDEIEKDINNVSIEKVELYASRDAISKFKGKYPNVIISSLY